MLIITPVNSYAEYRNIVKGKRLINNGFLPEEIDKYISQKRLSYFQTGNRLFLLYDEVKYYQLVCEGLISNGMPDSIPFVSSKPIVCHIVENKNSKPIAEVTAVLRKSGFHLRCTIHEYIHEHLADLPAVCNRDFIVCNKPEISSDCHTILSLWQKSLPLYEVTHMLPEDVQGLADKNRLVFLKESSGGRIAGACYFDVFLGTTTVHHIVTDPLFRGRGCAGILLSAWLEQAKPAGAKLARSWIEDSNISSQKSFSKIGFCKTPNLSYQFIK